MFWIFIFTVQIDGIKKDFKYDIINDEHKVHKYPNRYKVCWTVGNPYKT